jgi:hypothetical protein
MKNYSIILLLCLVIPNFCLAQQTVIADGRLPLESADQSLWLTHPAIQQAATQSRQYWLKHNTVYEEDFRIMDSREGNFTRERNQTAVLYLLSLWPRCCSNMGLAIVENQQLVRNIVFAGGTHHLFPVADINDDGLDELALVSSFGMGGSNETTLSVMSLANDSTILKGRFPLIQDNCATMSEHSERNFFRISFDKNAPDQFSIEQYQTGCNDVQDTDKVTSISSIPVEAAEINEDYIDLPIN